MKKSFILAAALTLGVVTASYSQTTTNSTATSPSTTAGQDTAAAGQHKHNSAAQPGTSTQKGTVAAPSTNAAATSGAGAPGASTSGAGAAAPGAAAPGSSATASGAAAAPAAAPKSNANEGSSRPGGTEHKNANDVGRYSEPKDSKSMLNSKEAVEQRNKNLTESDTTLKKGSGSAPKNMKDNTGKTGNYQNQEIKHNQKTTPRQ